MSRLNRIHVRCAGLTLVAVFGFFMTVSCGGGGGGTATPATLTSDQADTVGTATVELALQAMTDSLTAVQASPSISKAKGIHTTSPDKSVTIGTITFAAATSCELPAMTVCDAPSKTVDVSIGPDGAACAGTAKVCDTQIYVDLTCTNYVSGTATINGTMAFEMNNDTCDPASSVAADLTATVDGTSFSIDFSLSTVKTDTSLVTTGCFGGFEFTTSVDASDIATCVEPATCPAATDLTTLAALFAGTQCTYENEADLEDTSTTLSYTMLDVDLELTDTQIGCLLNAACEANESECISMTTLSAAATTCQLEDGNGEGSESCHGTVLPPTETGHCNFIDTELECEQSYMRYFASDDELGWTNLPVNGARYTYHNCLWTSEEGLPYTGCSSSGNGVDENTCTANGDDTGGIWSE